MLIHEHGKTVWRQKKYAKVYLVEYVSSKTQWSPEFSEQDETNFYTQHLFLINPKNISENEFGNSSGL